MSFFYATNISIFFGRLPQEMARDALWQRKLVESNYGSRIKGEVKLSRQKTTRNQHIYNVIYNHVPIVYYIILYYIMLYYIIYIVVDPENVNS